MDYSSTLMIFWLAVIEACLHDAEDLLSAITEKMQRIRFLVDMFRLGDQNDRDDVVKQVRELAEEWERNKRRESVLKEAVGNLVAS